MLWQGCDRFAPHPGRARRRALYPEAGKQVAWLRSRRSAVSALLPATAHSMAKDITPLSPDRRPAGRLPAPGSGLAAIYNRPAGAAQLHTPDDWARAFSAVRHRRWLVAGVVLFGTAAGAVGARFLKPTYQARATVWLELRDPGARDRARDEGPIQSGQVLGTATGWLDLLRSHVVLDSVVHRWRLYLKPKSAADSAALATFTAVDDVRPGRYRMDVDPATRAFRLLDVDDKVVLQQGTVGDSIGPAFGRSEEHTSELQSPCNLVCRLLLEKKKKNIKPTLTRKTQNNKQTSNK